MGHRGVLVIAHGSNNKDWITLVDEAVDRINLSFPVITCFLEMVEGRSIQDGMEALYQKGVKKIVAVPLLVSSGSTHIQEIKYFIGKFRRVDTQVKMTQAMDDHPLIEKIVQARAEELSTNPSEESLLLVGHGSKVKGFQEVWENGMNHLAQRLKVTMGFKEATFATIHPDNLYSRLVKLSQSDRVLVLPLFLSEGYFTEKIIPSRLGGLGVYSGKTYLPSTSVSEWIQTVVLEQIVN